MIRTFLTVTFGPVTCTHPVTWVFVRLWPAVSRTVPDRSDRVDPGITPVFVASGNPHRLGIGIQPTTGPEGGGVVGGTVTVGVGEGVVDGDGVVGEGEGVLGDGLAVGVALGDPDPLGDGEPPDPKIFTQSCSQVRCREFNPVVPCASRSAHQAPRVPGGRSVGMTISAAAASAINGLSQSTVGAGR
jgi:hypothetical protein